MPELPSGTVTFLFTDIERSTQTMEAMGNEAYADALDAHRKLLRDVFKGHEGHEVGTEGDSFFVAFAQASDAVQAALKSQAALTGHPLHVRMGMHTGEALVRLGEYVGHDVHKAKRVSDAGHGGQVLVSQTTADLVGGTVELVDLGPHRLKDLEEAQRLFQVGAGDFPPLRSLEAFMHSLPTQRSAFIGRESEIAEVRRLLDTNRIVTLTGVGGCGKTRLALQVAAEELEHFTGGVFFVNLAAISDPETVAAEVASAVGAPGSGALTAMAGGSGSIDDVVAHLSGRNSLVVLDNCEHILDVCADLTDRVLARCPAVKILATSREGLRVEGEQSWVIPSLSVPAEGDDPQTSESVSLFKARARSVRPDFELTPDNIGAVVEICQRLDGIPLAIEFAATRVGHLSPRQIAERLDDRFRLLTGGQRRVQRQQTLQAALDWSYELLDDRERALLRRLSVFQGDFALEAAEGVCSDDDLDAVAVTDLVGSLVSKSLVLADLSSQKVRYRLLETIRAYATERLTRAEEAERFRGRHRDWYLRWLSSISWEESFTSLDHWGRLVEERSNLRSAIDWSMSEGLHDIVGRMAAKLYCFYGGPAEVLELRRWFDFALEDEDALDPDDRVIALSAIGVRPFGALTGETLERLERAVEHAGVASPFAAAFALMGRGWMASILAAATRDDGLAARCFHDFDEAERLAGGSNDAMRALVSWFRGQTEMNFARVDAARVPLEEAVRLFRSSGDDAMAAWMGMWVATAAHIQGDRTVAPGVLDGWWRVVRLWGPADEPDWSPPGADALVAALTAEGRGIAAAWGFLRGQPGRVRQSLLELDRTTLVLGCAIVCSMEGAHHRAATLLSWYSANTFGRGWPPRSSADYVLYLHHRDLVRDSLTPDDIREARDAGASLSFDEALEFAFGETVES